MERSTFLNTHRIVGLVKNWPHRCCTLRFPENLDDEFIVLCDVAVQNGLSLSMWHLLIELVLTSDVPALFSVSLFKELLDRASGSELFPEHFVSWLFISLDVLRGSFPAPRSWESI